MGSHISICGTDAEQHSAASGFSLQLLVRPVFDSSNILGERLCAGYGLNSARDAVKRCISCALCFRNPLQVFAHDRAPIMGLRVSCANTKIRTKRAKRRKGFSRRMRFVH